MSGGIVTGTNLWEYDGLKAVLIAGGGVTRKPGSVAVWSGVTGSLSLNVTDGKVTGWTASGTSGKLVLATGDWAPLLARQSSTWTAKPAATSGQFLVEEKFATKSATR